jgi:hypothetical protein
LFHQPAAFDTNSKVLVFNYLQLGFIVCLYVGESKIIRTVGTCFAFGYTAGWAQQNTHGLLLSYHCGVGVTLIVHTVMSFLL